LNAVEFLLVEDSPIDAELAMRALKKAGLLNKLLWVKVWPRKHWTICTVRGNTPAETKPSHVLVFA
jgi:hypothetical protein